MTVDRKRNYVLRLVKMFPGCKAEDIASPMMSIGDVRSTISDAMKAGEIVNRSDSGEEYEITPKGEAFLRTYLTESMEKLVTILGTEEGAADPDQNERLRSSFIYRPRVADTLLFIKQHPNCLKKDVYEVMGGNGRSADSRINSLVKNGLVACTKGAEGRDIRLKLTSIGSDITDHIQTIESLMCFVGVRRWHTMSPTRYSSCARSATPRSASP
jgi:predicted transcriptional regulator